jgi:acetyl esterase/lipase
MPESPFPTQLRQANAALTHLLNKGIPPENIVVGGDSAGGNLSLQLASHILHSRPSLPPPPALEKPLAGGLLISPWNPYNVDTPSYAWNNSKDVLTVPAFECVVSLARVGITPDLRHYGEPLLAPPGWWQGLDDIDPRILITAGAHECPFDQVMETSTVITHYVRDSTTVAGGGTWGSCVQVRHERG